MKMKKYFVLVVISLFIGASGLFAQEETGYSQLEKGKTYYYDKSGKCLGYDMYDQKRRVTVHYACNKKEIGYAKKDSKTGKTFNYDKDGNVINYTKVTQQKTYRYDRDDMCLGYYKYDTRTKKRIYFNCDGTEHSYSKTVGGKTIFYGEFPYIGW